MLPRRFKPIPSRPRRPPEEATRGGRAAPGDREVEFPPRQSRLGGRSTSPPGAPLLSEAEASAPATPASPATSFGTGALLGTVAEELGPDEGILPSVTKKYKENSGNDAGDTKK